MIVSISVNSILDCMERAQEHIVSFPGNFFGPTLIGVLGECAVYNWARDGGLSPTWIKPGAKYAIPDIVLKQTKIDVKSSKSFDLERGKWFRIQPETISRISKHSNVLVFANVNIGRIFEDKARMSNLYRSGISVDILGWFPATFILMKKGVVPKNLYPIDRLRAMNHD